MDVASMGETVEVIRGAVAANCFTQHVVVNVAKLVNMRTDAQLKESVHSCDIINIDGMGVVLGARLTLPATTSKVPPTPITKVTPSWSRQRLIKFSFLGEVMATNRS